MNRVTWKKTVVPLDDVDEYLTRYNFQPGKFHLVHHPMRGVVTIVYVDNEIPTPKAKVE